MTTSHIQTRTVRAGVEADDHHRAVMLPIHLSTTFTFPEIGTKPEYDYSRSGNPTRDQLAEALATMEGGAGAVITSSGMSAVALVLATLRPGDRLLAPHDCYGGTHRLMAALADRDAFSVSHVDLTDEKTLRPSVFEGVRMVWIETPSNPLLRITDIRKVCGLAKAAGATVVVDNTFLSPVLQRPLALGADVVVHSTTKYLNGHSDVVGGAVVSSTSKVAEEMEWWANCIGLTGSPFDSYLVLRGLRTLHARMTTHEHNAHAVVDALEAHPAVEQVYYPGLVRHPGHRLAANQQSGFGAMVSFTLRGDRGDVGDFVQRLRCFSLAESLGGVESLVCHPGTMTHASMTPEARAVAGIGDSLVRLSVGIEHHSDLVADLRQALDRVDESSGPVDPLLVEVAR